MSEVTFENIDGLVLTERMPEKDERGSFCRAFNLELSDLTAGRGSLATCISMNFHAGTIRGLHIQIKPFEERKWITCLDGAIFDVVLDLRTSSPTFGCWASMELKAEDNLTLEIPEGVAHGYQTLSPHSRILYSILGTYSSSYRKTINPFDKELDVRWPLPASTISHTDRQAPSLYDYLKAT